MRTILTSAARCVAALIALGTLLNLLVRGVDAAFVVPDVLVTAALAVAAVLPVRHAVPALVSAFGLASGVFTVAFFAYIARGGFGAGVLVFDLVCVTMTALLSWRITLPARCGPQAAARTHAFME
ncbi:hypothetical protein [Streptomyces sp. NPDC006274]|uniref:hypothetical protein n=1 Tax=unclassified Streptomyces TaxID=2593676 RepID=UPI0033A75B87